MTQSRTLLTAEEFWRLYAGKDTRYELVKGELIEKNARYELVKGELIEMAPAGFAQVRIASRIHVALGIFLREHPLGEVMEDLGFYLQRQPDTVRGPDVAFVRAERIPSEGLPEGFFDGAPDLAVEVVSPNDSAAGLQQKVQEYLSHGTLAVWVFYPRTRAATVYRADGSARILTVGDNLTDEELLPGFSLPLEELFR